MKLSELLKLSDSPILLSHNGVIIADSDGYIGNINQFKNLKIIKIESFKSTGFYKQGLVVDV